MGDKKRGLVLCELRKFTVKFTFRHRIQLARGLIQDQNGSVAHQGPGQSNPLPLPSGKIYASLKIRFSMVSSPFGRRSRKGSTFPFCIASLTASLSESCSTSPIPTFSLNEMLYRVKS